MQRQLWRACGPGRRSEVGLGLCRGASRVVGDSVPWPDPAPLLRPHRPKAGSQTRDAGGQPPQKLLGEAARSLDHRRSVFVPVPPVHQVEREFTRIRPLRKGRGSLRLPKPKPLPRRWLGVTLPARLEKHPELASDLPRNQMMADCPTGPTSHVVKVLEGINPTDQETLLGNHGASLARC